MEDPVELCAWIMFHNPCVGGPLSYFSFYFPLLTTSDVKDFSVFILQQRKYSDDTVADRVNNGESAVINSFPEHIKYCTCLYI